MERIQGNTADPDGNGPGKNAFKDGDKAQAVTATIVSAAFLNGIQEEIANFIESRGLELNANDHTLLIQAINRDLAKTKTSAADTTATTVITPNTNNVLTLNFTPNTTGNLDVTGIINPAGQPNSPGIYHVITIAANGGAQTILADDQTLLAQCLKKQYLCQAGQHYTIRQTVHNKGALHVSVGRYLNYVFSPI